MAHGKHGGGVGIYVIVALVLGAITYVEFAIVEWPPAFMSSGWVLFWLIALSLVKFFLVIWFFMHLKDDDKLYTGFFSSGMVIGMGTFVALVFMFLLPRAVAPVIADVGEARHAGGYAAHGELPADVLANIATDGASRPRAQQAGTPRPADRTLVVTPPAARTDGFEVRLDDLWAGPASVAETGIADPEPPAVAADEPAPEAEPAAPSEPAPILARDADPTFDRALGAQVYAANCAACHQASGAGLPGVFPPLAGHGGDLYRAEGGIGGRQYLIDVMLYGLQGAITVGGATYNGLMPAWAQLGDEQIAAVINHTVAGFDGVDAPDGFDAIRPEEVAASRGQGLTATQVLELRAQLGDIPPPAAAAPEPSAEPATEAPATEATDTEPATEAPATEATDTEPATEAPATEAAAPAGPDPTYDRALGTEVYAASCAACHQLTGAGLPGVFPPLAGHAADLYAVEGGRAFLIDVMLYGLQGAITVDGFTYNGLMPAWAHLTDAQVSAVLNHTLAGFPSAPAPDGFDAIRPEEVAAQRGRGLTSAQVLELRQALELP